MKNDSYTTLQHLVFNTSFRKWVSGDADADTAFWEDWLAANPGKAAMVQDARIIISALTINLKAMPAVEAEKEIAAVISKLDIQEESLPAAQPTVEHYIENVIPFYKKTLFKAAAAFIIVGLATWYIVASLPAKKQDVVTGFLNNTNTAGYEKIINTDDTVKRVALPDGSNVMLGIKSDIVYAKNFTANYREVYLNGEAFFKVIKNPAHPFLVYTNSIVTKVLGTSFSVVAYPADSAATVTVTTGKVTVFKRENFKSAAASPAVQGAKIITANQRVVFKNGTELLKTIAEKPIVIIKEPEPENLVFSATPVTEVFARLQQMYGIGIFFNSDVLAKCSLSASLEDESFYDKLDIICKAINATYEIDDGNIIIHAKGCN